jgi:choline monooxygenase
VGDTSRVKVPGQVYPFTLLECMLDEPLVLTRDRGDALYCLSNVCTHRGTLVCEGAGVEQGLRCRYHGRRFELDGKFQFMPEFEGAAGSPSEKDNLPSLPLESWGPFLFTSVAPGAPFVRPLAVDRTKVSFLPCVWGFEAQTTVSTSTPRARRNPRTSDAKSPSSVS